MDEVREDYYDSLHEKNLARPRRPAGRFGATPTGKPAQQLAPVMIVQYPHLATLPERLRYLQRKESAAGFCQACGISLKAYHRLLRGAPADPHLLKKIAAATGCPPDWLKGQKEESDPMDTEEHDTAALSTELPQLDTLSARLTWARERKHLTVQALCTQIGWPKFKYHRVRNGSQLLHQDAAERLAQVLEVPLGWLTAGVAVAPDGPLRPRQSPAHGSSSQCLQLHIEGTYTPEHLTAILAGLGGHSFYVRLDLSETTME